MSEIWYRRLGFRSNPFSIKPAAFNNELVAYDLNFIYQRIDEGQMVFIDGPYGTGKTTILKNVIDHYRGKKRIIYYNFHKAETKLAISKRVNKVTPFHKKLVGLKQKDVILLLDEVNFIKISDAKEILKLYKKGILKSVILVNHDYYSSRLPKALEEYLTGNIIRTAKLNTTEAVDIVRRRIGDIAFLSDDMIRKIFTLAENNPRRLLLYCEDVCKYAMEIGDDMVTQEHLDDVLGRVMPKSEPSTPTKPAKKIQSASGHSSNSAPIIQEALPDSMASVEHITPPIPGANAKKQQLEELPEYQVVFYDSN